jgi:hypothetical protein
MTRTSLTPRGVWALALVATATPDEVVTETVPGFVARVPWYPLGTSQVFDAVSINHPGVAGFEVKKALIASLKEGLCDFVTLQKASENSSGRTGIASS